MSAFGSSSPSVTGVWSGGEATVAAAERYVSPFAAEPPAFLNLGAAGFGGVEALTSGGSAEVPESSLHALESLAYSCGIPPVHLPRNSASIPAEAMLRQFGAQTRNPEPWLPVAVLGPLLILAHYQPYATDAYQLPSWIQVRVLVAPEQYKALQQDLQGRLATKALPAHNPMADMPAPQLHASFKDLLDWYIGQYPMPDVERQKLAKLVAERNGKPLQTLDDLKFLPRNVGLAMAKLQNPAMVVYNAEEAPTQQTFPETILEKHGVYPLFVGKEILWIIGTNPSTYAFEDEWLSGGNDPLKIQNVIGDGSAIGAAIARSRSRGSRDSSAAAPVQIGELSYSDNENLVELDPSDMARINPANPNTTPEELVRWVMYRAITMRGSDLHVEKFFNTARFRARIDGELSTIHSCSDENLLRFIAIIKNWANMAQERQTTQDGRISLILGKRRIDVRVAAVPHRKEFQKIIMRFLDKQDGIRKLSELNMSSRQSSIIQQVLGRDQGLVLVTGPTGSGKTTTLYAFLNAINNENINIQTIEDPIEYEVEGINQTQTDPFHGLDFPTGLRALLRADPDVILIGESRDAETAGAAVNAALTGHLVLTTLHANDSLRAVSRLLSMGVEPYLLADALALSQAQRLVRKLCPYCKTPFAVTQQLNEFLYYQGVITEPITEALYQKQGCNECNGTGYTGRLPLMEMCLINGELASLIADGSPVTELRKIAISHGFKSLYQEGLVQVIGGLTTFDEINCLAYTALG